MEAGLQGEATPVAHSDVTPLPVQQEDSDVITEAPAIDHAPADTPEITTMQAGEEATTLIVEPKRGRGRPRKRPVIVDEKVMNEPRRLRGGKEIGGNTGVKGTGTSTGPQHLAKRIVEVFANRDVALAKAMTTLVLEGEPLAQGLQRSPSPPPAYDPPLHPPLKASQSKPTLTPLPSSSHLQSAANSEAILPPVHPPPGSSLPGLRVVATLAGNMKGVSTVRPTLAHKTQEAIVRVPSNTPPPLLLVPMSRSPTPHTAGSGGTVAALTYDQFSEFLQPAIHVLKRYYRQSRSGGVAQPIAVGSGPIAVYPSPLGCTQTC